MQAASLSTKTVFDMEKNAIVRSRLQLVEAMMRERNAAGAAKLAARAKAREDAAAEVDARAREHLRLVDVDVHRVASLQQIFARGTRLHRRGSTDEARGSTDFLHIQ